jgi:hypothetical protein
LVDATPLIQINYDVGHVAASELANTPAGRVV